jgi:predicted metalloprotease
MRSVIARWARRGGLAITLALSTAGAAAALPPDVPVPPRPLVAAADVTERDIAVSNDKIRAAYGALVSMWSSDFDRLGARFAAPGLMRYRGAVRTSCGVMPGDNAMYCPPRNTIYFDEVFVARQAKAAARELGTDGDMVAVGIIAHEMGHAVAIQLGEDSPVPYRNEAVADCLAGAFTQQAGREGSLEPGDLEEAFFGMAAAGDPTPQPTGDPRLDARMARRMAVLGHGTRVQRQANFKTGYDGGPGACLATLR